ncbi:response regulator [Candidatus Giovannonibacteria bacterium]|nr:response regulator [Candidatus Giovannonibacteria bacterium]
MANSDKKILIVDDDEFLLDMYSLKFREAGFQVELAHGGEDALKLLREGLAPDLILLDIVMPTIDGFEFLKIAGNENLKKNSRIIVLSNLGQKEDIERGISLGAEDYIVKANSTPSEVVKKIQSVLNKK